MRARSALFTLFGDVVRPSGGEAWLRDITAAMATVEVGAQAVRTALHRMSAEGWVEPRREGRFAAYQLTERGVARLERAAERIYRLRSRTWDGRWRLVASTRLADHPSLVAELEWIGYGRLQEGLWVSPHDHAREVAAVLAPLGPDVLVLDRAAGDDQAIARTAWDLDALREEHEAFLDRWRGASTRPEDDREAFRRRLELVHDWRKFLFRDPGLPDQVLPADWVGHRSAEVFRATYESLLEPSWRWWVEVQQDAVGEGVAVPDAEETPFAQGLAALGQPRE